MSSSRRRPGSSEKRSTGASDSTQVSLLPPPRWLETHRAALAAGDARQAARHHAVVAAAVGDEEHAQHQRAALEPAVVPDRRVRERQIFLEHVALRRTPAAAPSSAARPASSRPAAERPAPCARIVGNAGLITMPASRDVRRGERRRVAAPPRSPATGRCSGSPSSRSQIAGRNAAQRRRFEHAGAERIGDEHVARRATPARDPARRASSRRAARADRRSRRRGGAGSRARAAARRPSSGRRGRRAPSRSPPSTSVKPEIAREVGVLEVGLVVRARRQQHDVRRAVVAGARREQRVLQRAEERREQLDVQLAERVGEQPRDREAVLERVAGAGRRLRARADHAPLAVGAAREIEGDEVQEDAGRRPDAVAGAQEPADGRRPAPAESAPSLSSRCCAVEIGGDGVRAAARAGAGPRASALPFRRPAR